MSFSLDAVLPQAAFAAIYGPASGPTRFLPCCDQKRQPDRSRIGAGLGATTCLPRDAPAPLRCAAHYDQQVEEGWRLRRDVVGEWEAPRPGPVGLPERTVALQTSALLARPVLATQRDAFVV